VDFALSYTTLISAEEAQAAPEDRLLQTFPQWTLAHWCVAVFAASFILLAVLPEGRLNDFDVPNGAEPVRVARSLASQGTFADPFVPLRTGATAHVAPVYPLLYSLVLRGFGTGSSALRIAWALDLTFVALQMGLLPLLSSRMRLGVLPGVAAATLGTFSLYSPIDTRWESFLAGLLLLVTYFATETSLNQTSANRAVLAGVSWGVLLLTNPVSVLLLAAWPLCWLLVRPNSQRPQLRRQFALIITTALLVVLPWIARNYARFGTFIFVRDNVGLELWVGNNPCAAPSIRENIQSGCHARTHPNIGAAVAAQLTASGEVSFNRARLHEALNWISSNPRAFFSLTLSRVRLFWFPSLYRWWEAAFVWLVTLLSFEGIWLLAKRNSVAALLIGTAWLLFPLIYYITQFEPRYRYPIYWTSLLPAGYAVTEMFERLQRLVQKWPRRLPA
jgi:hypothetical protein